MFHAAIPLAPLAPSPMSRLLDCLSQASSRPRYAFMVLSLIAEVADAQGEAGPFVRRGGQQFTLRDWLCDSLAPMGGRDPRRIALAERVRSDLILEGRMPADPARAAALIEQEVRERVRASGKTNLSRAVSELVGAGLLRRYYKGYAIDHANRGGQRHAVYVLQGLARCLMAQPQGADGLPARRAPPRPIAPKPVQGELRFG
ncbi:MAG: hypothetical protein ACK4G2_13015 [Novosphingobium sp.]